MHARVAFRVRAQTLGQFFLQARGHDVGSCECGSCTLSGHGLYYYWVEWAIGCCSGFRFVSARPNWWLGCKWVSKSKSESDPKYCLLHPTSSKRLDCIYLSSQVFWRSFYFYIPAKTWFSTLQLFLNPSLPVTFLDGKTTSIYNLLTTGMSRIVWYPFYGLSRFTVGCKKNESRSADVR